ncbi:uncharacterized protein [Epargyreus clarus]|uniref:uncharacterized protein n=1 Tax=Epargyreus clarus TaxID=520877 RepID=UPI003C2EC1E4
MSKPTKSSPRAMPVETIITRFKSAQQRRQLREMDRSMSKITEILKNPVKPKSKNPKNQPKRNKKESKKDKPKVFVDDDYVDEEYYPMKLKRHLVFNKVQLKPKHDLKVIAQTNKRKRSIPQKGVYSDDECCPETSSRDGSPGSKRLKQVNDMSMCEMIQLIEDSGSLNDEDLLEILTCPSPVWWEDPPNGYMEDALFTRPRSTAEMYPSVRSQIQDNLERKRSNTPNVLSRREKLTTRGVKENVEKDIENSAKNSSVDLGIDLNNRDDKFKEKRSKLESVLGSLKSKTSDVTDSGNTSDVFNKVSVIRNLSNKVTVNLEGVGNLCANSTEDLMDMSHDDLCLSVLENMEIPTEETEETEEIDPQTLMEGLYVPILDTEPEKKDQIDGQDSIVSELEETGMITEQSEETGLIMQQNEETSVITEQVEESRMGNITQLVQETRMGDYTQFEESRMGDSTQMVEESRMGNITQLVQETRMGDYTQLDESRMGDSSQMVEESRMGNITQLVQETRMCDYTQLDESRMGDSSQMVEESRMGNITQLVQENRMGDYTQLDESRMGDSTQMVEESRMGNSTQLFETRMGDSTQIFEETRMSDSTQLLEERRMDNSTQFEETRMGGHTQILEETRMDNSTQFEETRMGGSTQMLQETGMDNSTEFDGTRMGGISTQLVQKPRTGGSIQILEDIRISAPTQMVEDTRMGDSTQLHQETKMSGPIQILEDVRIGDPTQIIQETRMGDSTQLLESRRGSIQILEDIRISAPTQMVDDSRMGNCTQLFEDTKMGDATQIIQETRMGDCTQLLESRMGDSTQLLETNMSNSTQIFETSMGKSTQIETRMGTTENTTVANDKAPYNPIFEDISDTSNDSTEGMRNCPNVYPNSYVTPNSIYNRPMDLAYGKKSSIIEDYLEMNLVEDEDTIIHKKQNEYSKNEFITPILSDPKYDVETDLSRSVIKFRNSDSNSIHIVKVEPRDSLVPRDLPPLRNCDRIKNPGSAPDHLPPLRRNPGVIITNESLKPKKTIIPFDNIESLNSALAQENLDSISDTNVCFLNEDEGDSFEKRAEENPSVIKSNNQIQQNGGKFDANSFPNDLGFNKNQLNFPVSALNFTQNIDMCKDFDFIQNPDVYGNQYNDLDIQSLTITKLSEPVPKPKEKPRTYSNQHIAKSNFNRKKYTNNNTNNMNKPKFVNNKVIAPPILKYDVQPDITITQKSPINNANEVPKAITLLQIVPDEIVNIQNEVTKETNTEFKLPPNPKEIVQNPEKTDSKDLLFYFKKCKNLYWQKSTEKNVPPPDKNGLANGKKEKPQNGINNVKTNNIDNTNVTPQISITQTEKVAKTDVKTTISKVNTTKKDKCIIVSNSKQIRYCMKCSSIFDTAKCNYCFRTNGTANKNQCATDYILKMEQRFVCDVCRYKALSKDSLERHVASCKGKNR